MLQGDRMFSVIISLKYGSSSSLVRSAGDLRRTSCAVRRQQRSEARELRVGPSNIVEADLQAHRRFCNTPCCCYCCYFPCESMRADINLSSIGVTTRPSRTREDARSRAASRAPSCPPARQLLQRCADQCSTRINRPYMCLMEHQPFSHPFKLEIVNHHSPSWNHLRDTRCP